MADVDFVARTIEKSWYKFNPILTYACIELLKLMKKDPPPDKFCWRFQHILFLVNKCMPMNLPYYWYKEGIIVDPEAVMLATKGIIKFKWEDDCVGCQIEQECPCYQNPYNNTFSEVEDKLRQITGM